MTAKRALLNYTIIQDIPFNVGQVIEDAILHNRDAKMNLGHPFLIFGLCKRVGVPLDDNEAWLHPIKAISVKRDTPGVPRPEGVYDSGHEPSDEDELHEYQARYGFLDDPQGDIGQSSSHPPPPPSQQPLEAAPSSPSPILRTRCSPSLSASMHFGTRPRSTESSSHRIWRPFVPICVLCWPTRPLFFSSSRPCKLRLHSFLPFTSHHRSDHQGSSLHPQLFLYCQWGHWVFCLGGWGVGGDRVSVLFCFVFSICVVFVFHSAY